MKVLSIVLILVFAIILSVIEVPKMLRGKQHMELLLFSVFLFLGTAAGIMKCAGIELSNPADWIAFIYSPFLGLIKQIMK